jgi:50S ribosomal protein L16 3-hydroxylase
MAKTRSETGSILLGGLSPRAFLRDHWQTRPLLVRGAFPDFVDPLDPDELAGLACEEGVESRIVRERGGRRPWEVQWGPHEESVFASLPDRGWTVLVQEVNRWVPEAAKLLDHFAFLPNVRVDDVMVSFAAPGGSVGPHVDSYDVFLVQGQGQRRWRYDPEPTKDTRLLPDLDLRILRSFPRSRTVEAVLGPGDMLYLPPGFAHHGVGVTPCLTYSIGFRAPSAGEVWASFAAAAAGSNAAAAKLLADPPLTPAENPGAIPDGLLRRVRALVRSLDLSDGAIDAWFAAFSTRLKPGHTLEAPRRPPDARMISRRLGRGDGLVRSEEARWAFLPAPRGGLRLFVGGAEIAVAREAGPLARELCARRRHQAERVRALAKAPAARSLLAHLFAIGAVAFGR